jgi:hypothetical protein
MTQTISKSSKARVERFVEEFIRSSRVEALTAERDRDFFNYPDRADRVYEAAEYGCEGKTHQEVIDDWRDAFDYMLRDRKAWNRPKRFEAAVQANFDETENWHMVNGSLFEVIG